jgi:hypothetical protein
VIFFTDGQPTLPHGPANERENILAVFAAADRAARGGIRIHSFAIGADALAGPLAAVEMAIRTAGSFTAVPDPARLPELMGDVRFTNLREVTLDNATTHVESPFFRLAADGSWVGFLPMFPGPNHIKVRALSDTGVAAVHQLEVQLDPSRPPPEKPERFVIQQNELMKICLVAREERVKKELRIEAERVLKELRIEMEHARTKARERANTQRKELTIEPEWPD